MLNILVQFIFDVLNKLSQILFSPLITLVTSLFPNVTQNIINISAFLSLAFTYLSCILRWLLFTPAMFGLLFSYFFTKYTIWVLSATFRLSIKAWNTLKL